MNQWPIINLWNKNRELTSTSFSSRGRSLWLCTWNSKCSIPPIWLPNLIGRLKPTVLWVRCRQTTVTIIALSDLGYSMICDWGPLLCKGRYNPAYGLRHLYKTTLHPKTQILNSDIPAHTDHICRSSTITARHSPILERTTKNFELWSNSVLQQNAELCRYLLSNFPAYFLAMASRHCLEPSLCCSPSNT